MKRYLSLFLLLTINILIVCSQAIGEWTIYPAYHDATQAIPVNNLIYVLSDGSLYSYDKDDSSITTYDKATHLNDNDIANIAYNKNLNTLLIVYKNSNIDLLTNNSDVYNIADFMNKIMTEDKSLNNIYIHSDYAYLSTNFGIVIVNIRKKEITNTYNLGKKVYNSCLMNDTIFTATDEGVYVGDTKKNLLDNKNWDLISSIRFDNIVSFDNKIVANLSVDALYVYNSSTKQFDGLIAGKYTFMNTINDKLIAGNSNQLLIFNTLESKITINQDENFKSLSFDKNNIYWGCHGDKGLIGYQYNEKDNKLVETVGSIIPNSPRRNLGYQLIYTDKLLVAGGGIWFDRYYDPGTIMEYADHNWEYYEEGNAISDKTGLSYMDITSIAQDPNDPNHIFATAAGEGLYEFKDRKFVKLYNTDNSELESIYPNQQGLEYIYIRISGLQYDKSGNLWMLNSMVKRPEVASIKVLKKDGSWLKFHHSTFSNMETLGTTNFDKRGWVWITSTKQPAGLFCLNTNNTLENTADDQYRFRETFVNQDNKKIEPYSVYCIAEDKNGVMWVGTDKGPLVINNPTNYFNENFYVTQIKVPRNDGTNNADLLLENESIKTICIDGANRKWIGTEGGGVYLISEDGLETIHHFTVDNSPLISNIINSITIDPETGMVYIGTEKGIVSYRSDATEPGNSFSENAHVFPNPVYSSYDGVITVTGLVRDSDVKIIDTSGNLIYSGTSLGGQFSWDGRNRNGSRVSSGVYFVLAANAEGKEGIVTKILMIK